MKRFELIIALILIPVDLLMLFTAAFTAYTLRFEGFVTQYRPVIFELPFSDYLQVAIPLIVLWIILFALSGLYTIGHPRKILTEIKKIVVAGFLGFSAITILIFLRGELFTSRFIVLAGTLLAIVLVVFARMLVRLARFQFYKHRIGSRQVVLVGSDESTNRVFESIQSNYRHGLFVAMRLNTADENSLKKLKALLDNNKIDFFVGKNELFFEMDFLSHSQNFSMS